MIIYGHMQFPHDTVARMGTSLDAVVTPEAAADIPYVHRHGVVIIAAYPFAGHGMCRAGHDA